jgi:hypothetical protein
VVADVFKLESRDCHIYAPGDDAELSSRRILFLKSSLDVREEDYVPAF